MENGIVKDISQYIDFSKNEQGTPKLKGGIKALMNLPCIVRDWEFKTGTHRDGKKSDDYIKITVELTFGRFYVNTSSENLRKELIKIDKKKAELGETDKSFSCIFREASGGGFFMYPMTER